MPERLLKQTGIPSSGEMIKEKLSALLTTGVLLAGSVVFRSRCKHRMGQDWRPNMAMSTDLILEYLRLVEIRIAESATISELNRWVLTQSLLT
jgi:hypothetical protein